MDADPPILLRRPKPFDMNDGEILSEMANRIAQQHAPEGLIAIGGEIDRTLDSLMAGRVDIPEVLAVMGELHDRLTARILQVCEERMVVAGRGRPPAGYCWINMGSAARREQTLRTDQDNAVIYADPPEEMAPAVHSYFAELTQKAVDLLADCGFARCSGGVMASRPEWRRTLSGWMAAVDGWIASPRPEDTRILTILLDFRVVWGDAELGKRLHDRIFEAFHQSDAASHLLTRDDRQLDIPLSFKGAIVTKKKGPHRNQIDLKAAGLAPIANGLRVFSIRHGISEPSTFGRLDALAGKGVIAPEDVDLIRTSFEILMRFRIRSNLEKVRMGLPADNHLDPRTLSRDEQQLLTDALHGASRLRKLVKSHFGLFWMNFFGA
ncbi:MAG: DUF294 nucleotidyltransferase-like domain-containing protein [Desulfobacterales bacterium]